MDLSGEGEGVGDAGADHGEDGDEACVLGVCGSDPLDVEVTLTGGVKGDELVTAAMLEGYVEDEGHERGVLGVDVEAEDLPPLGLVPCDGESTVDGIIFEHGGLFVVPDPTGGDVIPKLFRLGEGGHSFCF